MKCRQRRGMRLFASASIRSSGRSKGCQRSTAIVPVRSTQGTFQLLHSGLDGAWVDHSTEFLTFGSQLSLAMDYPGPDYQNFMLMDIDADEKVSPEENERHDRLSGRPLAG